MTNSFGFESVVMCGEPPCWEWILMLLLPILQSVVCAYLFIHGWFRRRSHGMAHPFPSLLVTVAVGGGGIHFFAATRLMGLMFSAAATGHFDAAPFVTSIGDVLIVFAPEILIVAFAMLGAMWLSHSKPRCH
jgi:hypothetical protein